MNNGGAEQQPSPEQEIAMLRRQVADLQRLAVLGELLGTASHEFNNVVMIIKNYAEMGLRHRDDATRDKCFEKITAAQQRAAKIVSAVLGVARNRAQSQEPTDLAALIDDVLFLMERELQKYRVRVERQFTPVPRVPANGNQIQQVILNLLVNARQAMPQGGRIILRLSYDESARMVELLIRDHGTGIAPEKLPHIFDPYFTTKRGPDESGKGGTGLGLAACRDIIDEHRGRIRVESAVGKGTAFTIRLPIAPPAVPAGENSLAADPTRQPA